MNRKLISSTVHGCFVVAENVCQVKDHTTSYFNTLKHIWYMMVYDASGMQHRANL